MAVGVPAIAPVIYAFVEVSDVASQFDEFRLDRRAVEENSTDANTVRAHSIMRYQIVSEESFHLPITHFCCDL